MNQIWPDITAMPVIFVDFYAEMGLFTVQTNIFTVMAANTDTSLHDLARQQRRLSGLSQADLAKLAGVGKTAVFDLEHGKRSIRFDTLIKILAVLNIKISFAAPPVHSGPIELRDSGRKTK